jgi:hypothetical protein
MPENPGGFARLVFQKCSNSRLMGKVPKFHIAAAAFIFQIAGCCLLLLRNTD